MIQHDPQPGLLSGMDKNLGFTTFLNQFFEMWITMITFSEAGEQLIPWKSCKSSCFLVDMEMNWEHSTQDLTPATSCSVVLPLDIT